MDRPTKEAAAEFYETANAGGPSASLEEERRQNHGIPAWLVESPPYEQIISPVRREIWMVDPIWTPEAKTGPMAPGRVSV
jgi:hypothetical protein